MLWGSEKRVNQMARLTELELDVKEPQWTYIVAVSIRRDPRKSTMHVMRKHPWRDSTIMPTATKHTDTDIGACDVTK